MKKAVYPGSFDPVTLGHMNIIEKGSRLFDRLAVGVLNNTAKKTMFSAEQRLAMLRLATAHLSNVSVTSFDGLLADFARSEDTPYILRGLRSYNDFSTEYTITTVNKSQDSTLETVFLTPDLPYSYLSSTAVRDLVLYGGRVEAYVPEAVYRYMQDIKK